MALNWRTLNAIPYLRDYAAASKREAETKPIRGDAEKTKPLGRRNQKYRCIKRMPDNSIAIFDGWRENHTPRIQFFENGDIHILADGYPTKAATNEVITEVTGATVHTEGGKAWIRYDGGIAPLHEVPRSKYVPGKGWVPATEKVEPSVFRRKENGRLEYINPPVLVTHVVNRKGANAVRRRYATTLGYIEALTKLRRDDTPRWKEIEQAFPGRFDAAGNLWSNSGKLPEVHSTRGFMRKHAVELVLLMRSEDLNDHYKAYLWLQRGAETKATMRNADKVLSWVHRDEWFMARESVVGQKVHDRYAWAFAE